MRGYLSEGIHWLNADAANSPDFVVVGAAVDARRWRQLMCAAVVKDRAQHLERLIVARPLGATLDILIDPDYTGPRSLLAYASDEGLANVVAVLRRHGAVELRQRSFSMMGPRHL
jgi:hypothetical protein